MNSPLLLRQPAKKSSWRNPPGEMKAMFLDEILIGLEIKEGHLWIRSDGEGDFTSFSAV